MWFAERNVLAQGRDAKQAVIAFRDADAYPGPALIHAYSHCIGHGFELRYGMKHELDTTCWPRRTPTAPPLRSPYRGMLHGGPTCKLRMLRPERVAY